LFIWVTLSYTDGKTHKSYILQRKTAFSQQKM